MISSLSPVFKPANPDVTVASLQQKQARILSVGERLSNGYANWKQALASRNQKFEQLSDSCILIKEAVKAQYGINSTEYGLIKSLSV